MTLKLNGIVSGIAKLRCHKILFENRRILVFKKSSIAALQQQLAQLETLGDEQLNGLLKRLENQKYKLPIEDRSVIDWGISLIRAKMREEDLLMSETWKKLEVQYDLRHRDFVKQSGWEPYNKDDFGASLKIHLQEIAVAACTSKAPDRARKYAHKLSGYLYTFCHEEGIVYNELIDGCTSFCTKRFERYRNPEDKDYDPAHADCYKHLAKGLKE